MLNAQSEKAAAMMLYEAVHLQQSEAYYDYTNPTTAKMKERERVKVQRTKSLSNVQRFINQQQDISRRGSYVVGQKLRESKWFNHDELKVFCAVVETGFIVQRKDDINDELEFGIAVWNTGEGELSFVMRSIGVRLLKLLRLLRVYRAATTHSTVRGANENNIVH